MNFYIASRLENAARVRDLASILKARGHVHTYDWTMHGSVQNEGSDVIAKVASREHAGVRSADTVIVLLPGGRGTHAELGMAIAWATVVAEDTGDPIRILVLSESPEIDFGEDGRTCAFYHHPLVKRIGSWAELLDALGVAP